MAITTDKDITTGLELEGIYYRIDKINFNDVDFQVTLTGYASEEAYRNRAYPLVQPRHFVQDGYDKEMLNNSSVFEYAYDFVKSQEGFEAADDVFEEDQLEQLEGSIETENILNETEAS